MELTKDQAQKAIHQLKRNLCQRFGDDIIQLYLFGSVARGDFGPESDIDILILFNAPLTREIEKAIMNVIFQIELDNDVVFGPMIESKSDWNTPLFQVMPIHKTIDREGLAV